MVAVVAVEPMGPPFADIPNIGLLHWGLTAAPLTFDSPRASCEEVRNAPLAALRVPALANLPILVLTAEVSNFAAASTLIVNILLRPAQPPSCCICRITASTDGHGPI